MTSEPCPFCDILAGRAPATIYREWPDAIAIAPLNPVTPGHTLIISREHVENVCVAPDVAAQTMRRAAELSFGTGSLNIITSVGPDATQTVFHLHIHLVPRSPDDGLRLPWPSEET